MTFQMNGYNGWRQMVVVILIAMLLGCSGGSSAPSTAAGDGDGNGQGPQSELGNANGIWQGIRRESDQGFDHLFVLLINGEMVARSQAANLIYQAEYTIEGERIAGDVRRWNVAEERFDATGTMGGTFSAQSGIAADLVFDSGSGCSMTLEIHPADDRPPAPHFADIVGAWADDDGIEIGMIEIDAHGTIRGMDRNRCIYDGVVSMQDPSKNLYIIDIDVTECGDLSGSYGGFAVLRDEDLLSYYMTKTDHTFIVFNDLQRQQ